LAEAGRKGATLLKLSTLFSITLIVLGVILYILTIQSHASSLIRLVIAEVGSIAIGIGGIVLLSSLKDKL
jgi:hypothetical protein